MSLLAFFVHSVRIKLTADAVVVQAIGGDLTDALVTKGCQVEVVAADTGSVGEADQLGAIWPGLAVVFGQVGMKVHPENHIPVVIPTQYPFVGNLSLWTFTYPGTIVTLWQ